MTSRPSPTKRAPSSSLPPYKTPCQIASSAIVADKASISGTHAITIKDQVVIHPYAKITAGAGDVVIGEGSFVSERAVVGSAEETGAGNSDVVLEAYVSIESNAVVEAKHVSEGSTIEVGAKIGRGAVLGKYCKIAALCQVGPGEVLPDYTVVYGPDNRRRHDNTMAKNEIIRHKRLEGQKMQYELLRKLIPDSSARWL